MWQWWEEEKEGGGGGGTANTPGKATVSQGTAGNIIKRQNSHSPSSALGQRTRPQGAARPPQLPPQGQGYSITPGPPTVLLRPSSTVTWATQVNAWLYLMNVVSHGDSDVRRSAKSFSPPPPGEVWRWRSDFVLITWRTPTRLGRWKLERNRHPVWRTWGLRLIRLKQRKLETRKTVQNN